VCVAQTSSIQADKGRSTEADNIFRLSTNSEWLLTKELLDQVLNTIHCPCRPDSEPKPVRRLLTYADTAPNGKQDKRIIFNGANVGTGPCCSF
jgi:hypothetical protein